MAQILVPGVCQAKLQGTINGHLWNAIWHFSLGGGGVAWTPGELGSVANAIVTNWGSQLARFFAPATVLDSVSTVDIGQAAPAVGQSTAAQVPGTGTGNELAPQLTTNVRFLIASRYRGGHPRTALPAMDSSHLNATDDSYAPTSVGQFNTAISNVFDAVFAAVPGCFQVVPRYTYTYVDDPAGHKYLVQRTGLKGTPPQVLNWETQTVIGTVRRRNSSGG